MALNDFIEKYIPNNHWLTKSMEINKLEYGTYWHLKKMIVYYYYIFVLGKLDIDGINNIRKNFEAFIDSLDENAKDKAREFFFATDIRNLDVLITPSEFLYTTRLDVRDDELLMAKKYYYLYLMNLIPESENSPQYKIYTSCLSERNYFKGINKIKPIIVKKYGVAKFQRYVGDAVSQLRNERKILNLFGLLNASYPEMEEKCSPTSIGMACISSNFNEFILFMEIQKIKQISRNPLTQYDVSDRARNRKFNSSANVEHILHNFNIKRHPYFLFLSYLLEKKTITTQDFRYILARTTDNNSLVDVLELSKINIHEIKNKIREVDKKFIIPGSNNTSEDYIPGEDFSKEFKKYFLGITNSELDYSNNLFGFATYKKGSGKLVLTDEIKLSKLLEVYDLIYQYLDVQSNLVYEIAKELQKEKYILMTENTNFDCRSSLYIDATKEWVYYYFGLDFEVVRMLLAGISKVLDLSDDEILNKFPFIIKKFFGIKGKKNILDKLFDSNEELQEESFIIPKIITLDMLVDESGKYLDSITSLSEARKRNIAIIEMYKKWAFQNNLNHCELCGAPLEHDANSRVVGDVHHLIPFNEEQAFGPDDYRNLLLVCPTCHRILHRKLDEEQSASVVNKINNNSYLQQHVYDRIKNMNNEGFLYPSGLNYALEHGYINQDEFKKLINK